MTKPDVEVVVCIPVEGTPEESRMAGSEVRWCSVCADAVWISPDGLRFLEQRPAVQIQCNECAYGALATVDEYRIEGVPGSERLPYQRPVLAEFRRRVERRKRQR